MADKASRGVHSISPGPDGELARQAEQTDAVTDTPFDPTILVFRLAPWITKPGIYRMTNEEYHSDPVVGGSVSSTVLRLMTPPKGTPRHARNYLDESRPPRGYYDIGSAYHVGVLGIGDEVVEVKAKDWKTRAAQQARRDGYAAGKLPLLTDEITAVRRMVAETMAHPYAGGFFVPGTFTAEFVIVWEDPETGVMCRAMIDCLPHYTDTMTVVDLKTKAGDADPDSVSTSIARYRYHQQFAFYIAGLRELIRIGILPPVLDIRPWLVVIGKDAPYVPLARPVDRESIDIGTEQNRKALDLYAECIHRRAWPGYDEPENDEPEPLGLPGWEKYRYRTAAAAGIYDTTGDVW